MKIEKLEQEIKKLISLINKLEKSSGFRLYRSLDEIYSHKNHMGAIMVDGILQAGINYDTVVKPRVEKIGIIKKAKTTKGFYAFYSRQGLEKLINFRGKKIETIKSLVNLFIKEKIDNPKELKKWIENNKNLKKLIMINGIGDKTVDYFKILVGIPTVAIDRHLINFLRKANISIGDYKKAREIINSTADKMKIGRALLDYSIWKYMSDKSKNEKEKRSKRLNINKIVTCSKKLKEPEKIDRNQRQIFWGKFIEKARSKELPYFNEFHNVDDGWGWICEGFGVPYISICLVATRNNARIEIFINSGDEKKNQEIFSLFNKYKNEIEKIFDDKLRWRDHGINGRPIKSKIIDYEYNGVNIDNKNDWDKIIDFFLDRVEKMNRAFREPIRELNNR